MSGNNTSNTNVTFNALKSHFDPNKKKKPRSKKKEKTVLEQAKELAKYIF